MMRPPNRARSITLALGALSALAALSGVGVLIGWPLDSSLSEEGRASWPEAGIGLLGCAVALACVGSGRARRVGFAAAGIGALMGVLGLVGVELHAARRLLGSGAWGAEPHELSIATGLLLSSGALTMLLGRRRFAERAARLPWLCGIVVTCFGAATLLAKLSGLEVHHGPWNQTAVEVLAAAAQVALGLGIVAVIARDAEEAAFSWTGLAVLAGVALAVLAFWTALVKEERRHVERTVRHEVASGRFQVTRAVNERLNDLLRMAERWAVGRAPLREEWEADAALHVSQVPGLDALAWVDPEGEPRLFVGMPGAAIGVGDIEGRWCTGAAGPPRETSLSRSFGLAGGARAFAARAPIWADERYSGCIVAVFRAEAVLAPALLETREHYHVVLSDTGGELLPGFERGTDPHLVQEGELRLPGSTWRIQVAPRPSWLAELQNRGLRFGLGTGLVLAVLAGSTVSLARTARQRLRSVQGLLESAPDAMVVVDASGTVVLVNAEAERLFGYPRSEITGSPVDRLVPTRLLSRHREGRERYFSEPALRVQGPLEVVARRRDGSEFPAEISLSAIASERGPLVSSSIRDITGRRDEEVRRRLAAIVTSSSDAILGKRTDGTIVDWNRGAERIFGWTADEAIGRSVAMITPEDQQEEMRENLESVRLGRVIDQLETVRVRKDGERIHMSLSVYPILDESGTVVGAASIGRDVSDLRRAQEDLRVQRDALAAANAELARSNSDLDQFASAVSHDLKAPLRGISSLSEWLAEDHGEALGPEGREQLDLLQARAARMYRLIDGILDYSRAGRSRKPAFVDCRSILLEVVDVLGPPEGFDVQLAPDLPTVVYDEAQLTQIFQNLVDNAIRHMGRDSGAIQVDVREHDDAWEFHVADDGVGIPERHRERIFRIFQTLSRDSGSTGVGLAVVKKIVEANGGHIWINPRPGGGSDFCFTVPK